MKIFKHDINKFYDFFKLFPAIETDFQKLNKKYYLHNKEIYNLGSIIKFKEFYRYNNEKFEQYFKDIINNLLEQTSNLYNNNYYNYYAITTDLNKIIDKSFKVKTEEYIDLRFFIFLRNKNKIN